MSRRFARGAHVETENARGRQLGAGESKNASVARVLLAVACGIAVFAGCYGVGVVGLGGVNDAVDAGGAAGDVAAGTDASANAGASVDASAGTSGMGAITSMGASANSVAYADETDETTEASDQETSSSETDSSATDAADSADSSSDTDTSANGSSGGKLVVLGEEDSEDTTAADERDADQEDATADTSVEEEVSVLRFLIGGSDNVINTQQLPDSSFIFDTSIDDLSTADSYYDGQTVQVVGEAVGDILNVEGNADYRWVTLQSTTEDTNASISVYMTAEQAELIDALGRYGTTGTMLQVRGTFNLACAEHSGLSDLHAEHVSVVEAGKEASEEFDIQSFMWGAILVAVGLIMTLVFYVLRERRR